VPTGAALSLFQASWADIAAARTGDGASWMPKQVQHDGWSSGPVQASAVAAKELPATGKDLPFCLPIGGNPGG